MNYRGSCHCGSVTFEATGELTEVGNCNCSICSRKRALHWFVPEDQFHLNTDEHTLSTYMFNKHIIKHKFCPICGIHVFGTGVTPDGSRIVAVNACCLEDVDLSKVLVKEFDGRSL